MSAQARLILTPRQCDRCGACLSACPLNALRVGRAYIMVDWARCDGCGKCVAVCERGAIKSSTAQTPRARSAAKAAATGKKPAAAPG